MLVAAPESSCGAVGEDEPGVAPKVAPEPLASLREPLRVGSGQAGGAPVTTWVLVPRAIPSAAKAGRSCAACSARLKSCPSRFAVRSANRDCWASSGWGIYSVAGVSSRELAKWAPMPLAFSEEEAIH